VLLVVGLVAVRTDHQPDTSRDYPSRAMLPHTEPVLLPPPPMDDEYLPCSDCHADEPPNPTPRELEDEHDEMAFAHGDLWCMHCHVADEDRLLQLADDTQVAFDESWRLCTQCHGKKLSDWRAGVHGKRTGHWRGPSEYRNCVACHNPHRPPFEPLKPKPPPLRPEQITLSGAPAEEAAHE
jgi:mono/diheme cytochrome c family protein